jgi:hypothetical protein
MGFIDLEVQQASFMGRCWITLIHPRTGPMLEHGVHKIAHGTIALQMGAKVEGLAGGLGIVG